MTYSSFNDEETAARPRPVEWQRPAFGSAEAAHERGAVASSPVSVSFAQPGTAHAETAEAARGAAKVAFNPVAPSKTAHEGETFYGAQTPPPAELLPNGMATELAGPRPANFAGYPGSTAAAPLQAFNPWTDGTVAFPRPPLADLPAPDTRGAGIEGLMQRGRDWDELDLEFLPETQTLWCHMRPKGPPSFTQELLGQLIGLRRGVQQIFAQQRPQQAAPLRFFVGGSRLPGIYNLGGDLASFARMIRSRDREGLRRYAHDCVDVGYHMATGFRTPVITIALVKGDALGGGFEGALSFHVLVAEKRARFGLPEVMFNLFPGMGAYSFLMRRVGAPMAERMILSGRIYTAQELHALGIVDVLAEDGEGEQAVHDYIQATARKHAAHRAIYEIRQRVNPVSLQELRDVTDIWVDTALGLTEGDLRRMEKLTQAQRRRIAGSDGTIATEAPAA